MTLPIDIILVRHGESEGNAAKRLSEKGDDHIFTSTFRNRHTSSFRLTEKGRDQAKKAGAYIRTNLLPFDRYLVSEYIRTKETAALLELPDARWFCDFYLAERDWGNLDVCTEAEKTKKIGEAIQRRDAEPFFWKPPGGESYAQLCLRVDRILHTLHRECSDKRVILVCHGEVIRAFQVRLERLSQERFRELDLSKNQIDRIYNCQIVHYTRRDPSNGQISRYMNWARWIRPTETPAIISPWKTIVRPSYSNEELLAVVEQVKPTIF